MDNPPELNQSDSSEVSNHRKRLIAYRSWFAWRPVRLESGRWSWLSRVQRKRWGYRLGDHYFEGFSYALLP